MPAVHSKQLRHCPHCDDYSTRNPSTLSMHITNHHRGVKRHPCPLCSERFCSKTQLQHHFVNHHCEADIPCKFDGCNLLFKSPTTHKIHYVRKHMKHVKMFATDIFGELCCCKCRGYYKSSAMFYHQSICHPQSPFCKETIAFNESLEGLMALGDLDEGVFDVEPDSASTPAPIPTPTPIPVLAPTPTEEDDDEEMELLQNILD